MIDLDLTGRTAFVSGSTQGIGLAIAQRLALAGARVAVNGRSAQRVQEALEALVGGGVEVAATVDLGTHPTPENLAYLTTKRDRLGHHLVDLPTTLTTPLTDGDPS